MDEYKFSLDDINYIGRREPRLLGMIERKLSTNKEVFLKQLDLDICDALYDLQKKKHIYQNDKWGEDELTFQVVSFLQARLWDAEHDTQHGGHIDILVKSEGGNHEWLGEAKLWDGPKYIHGGWIQLTEKYGTGTLRDDHGGMILYIKADKAADKMKTWKNYLTKHSAKVEVTLDPINPLVFHSVSPHPATSLPYSVKHFAVALFHHKSTK